ncbi:MAG: hypothetical protein ACREU1_12975 [Burkholderiales bacterium]
MFKHVLVAIAISLGLGACAGVKFTERNVSIVTATNAEKGKGPTGISNTFSLEGIVVAYATFRWDSGDVGGPQTIEVKWYNGDKLVSTRSNTFQFERSPFHVWFRFTSVGLGVGKCRVEFYSNGLLIGSKSFSVVEKL